MPEAEERTAATVSPEARLHASAVASGQTVIALAGESGDGKSTLAAALASAGSRRRVADDLLPLELSGGAARALPRYPQPGVARLGELASAEPTAMELAGIYLLSQEATDIEVRKLSRRQAALGLVRHTVAARLFDHELQGRHLEACAKLTRRLPVRALAYPRRLEMLPSVIAAIEGNGAS
jgi:hypothetical protein